MDGVLKPRELLRLEEDSSMRQRIVDLAPVSNDEAVHPVEVKVPDAIKTAELERDATPNKFTDDELDGITSEVNASQKCLIVKPGDHLDIRQRRRHIGTRGKRAHSITAPSGRFQP
ncbi:MAG: hypothetical protein KF684_08750 [Phycisphaeraceae bacterium]|nr:hypothetical protein [Phycisphaeraceae bacterium]